MKRIFSTLLLCAALSWLCADPADPKQTALEKEKKGDIAGAVSSYGEWLKANPSSPVFAETLFHAVDIHPDLKQSIVLLESCRNLNPAKAVQSAIMGKTATLHEISGDLLKARELFERAYYENSGEDTFPYLYRAARLLFEMGEKEESGNHARLITSLCKNPITRKRAAFLLARLEAASGSLESALSAALRLTEDPAGSVDNESIYLFIFTLADSLGKQPERTLALQGLAKNYPDSPEFRMASHAAGRNSGGGVSLLPTPSTLLNPFAAFSTTSATPAAPATSAALSETPPPAAVPASAQPQTQSQQQPQTQQAQPPRALGVQTGSFSVRENAEYMVRDLGASGFAAEILVATGKTGNPVYKVIIPIEPDSGGDAQNLLIRLKEKSVEGFLLF